MKKGHGTKRDKRQSDTVASEPKDPERETETQGQRCKNDGRDIRTETLKSEKSRKK
jgi:hypothetical protein